MMASMQYETARFPTPPSRLSMRRRCLIYGVLGAVFLGLVATTSSRAASTNYVSLASIQKDITSFTKTLKATGSVSYALNSSVADQVLHATTESNTPKPLAGEKCFSNGFVPIMNPDMSECVWTNPTSDVTILLFGDSHAQQWLRVFIDIANLRGFRLVTLMHTACGAAQLTSRPSVQAAAREACTTWHDKVFEEIPQLHPSVVIFASSIQDLPSNAYAAEVELNGILTRALGSASRVISLHDTPNQQFKIGGNPITPAACLAHNQLKTIYNPKAFTKKVGTYDCYRPFRSTLYAVNDATRDQVAQADVDSGVQVIEPMPWFCNVSSTGLCPPVILDTFIYRDWAHMRSEYLERLTMLLDASIKTIPKSPVSLRIATRTSTTATFAWNKSFDGHAPISGYVATVSPGGKTCSTVLLGCTVEGLTPGGSYSVSLRATNAIGPSANKILTFKTLR
ncbi:unannotated protein [freshwater metagenome]|uniref:Unannotated protein n=1 Tax=freshwater metagenome TaxID=449393 RepID=A0A6J7DHF0_9ZZZZ|nr:hypothetical protein [Actinomycetota bacterium]